MIVTVVYSYFSWEYYHGVMGPGSIPGPITSFSTVLCCLRGVASGVAKEAVGAAAGAVLTPGITVTLSRRQMIRRLAVRLYAFLTSSRHDCLDHRLDVDWYRSIADFQRSICEWQKTDVSTARGILVSKRKVLTNYVIISRHSVLH